LKQVFPFLLIIRPAIQYKSGTGPTHISFTGLSLSIGAKIQGQLSIATFFIGFLKKFRKKIFA
jgi:hypothetical protein